MRFRSHLTGTRARDGGLWRRGDARDHDRVRHDGIDDHGFHDRVGNDGGR